MEGTVTSQLKCPECQSNCMVIKENLVFFDNNDWVLFECSSDTCGTLILRRSDEAIRVNLNVLKTIHWHNGGSKLSGLRDNMETLQAGLGSLGIQKAEIDRQIARTEKMLESIREKIAKLDQLDQFDFWQRLFDRFK